MNNSTVFTLKDPEAGHPVPEVDIWGWGAWKYFIYLL